MLLETNDKATGSFDAQKVAVRREGDARDRQRMEDEALATVTTHFDVSVGGLLVL